MHVMVALAVFLSACLFAAPTFATECDAPNPEWLLCEDFERGDGDFAAWYDGSEFVECKGCREGNTANPDRILLTGDEVYDGSYALHMPAGEAAGFRGASLAYRTCDGEQRQSCALAGHERLHWRAWVKLAPDHGYVHHFMSIGGTRSGGFWDADGNAGCRPNGYRAAGTTVDFNTDHELFFYTYTPDMRCDAGGYCSGNYAANICDGCASKDMACDNGPECCWGNHYSADPRPTLPKDQWVCLEMMMQLNTPGDNDGEMAFWIDDELGHHQDGMRWRDVPELQLNKVWVQHYIDSGDADQSNRIWWDNIVVSTDRIGCGQTPVTPGEDVGGTAPDAGTPEMDPGEMMAAPDVGGGADGSAQPGGDDAAGDTGAVDGGCGCSLATDTSPRSSVVLFFGVLAGLMLLRRRG